MADSIYCPLCRSNDIYFRSDNCLCASCGNRFVPNKNNLSDEQLLSTQTTNPQRLFISYAHKQSSVVTEIVKALQKRGHIVWFDRYQIEHGSDWRKAITDGLLDSNGVLSFLSKDAIRSNGVCLDELSIAVGVKYGNIRTVLLQKESELQPIPMQLTHRQWLDMSDWEEKSKGKDSHYQDWLNHKIAEIIRMVESDETREFAGDISHIRNKLNISDETISRQSWYLKQIFVGREWLTKEIEEWIRSDQSKQTYVIYGKPGSGKSAFAAQYTYRSRSVVASLFFEHGNDYFNSPKVIIKELAFQISCRISSYRKILISTLNDLYNIELFNSKELAERLLSYPLQLAVDGEHEKVAIVIDGLDECTREQQNEIIEVLNSIRLPSWMRLLILTRPEANITERLASSCEMWLDQSCKQNIEDIQSYLNALQHAKIIPQLSSDETAKIIDSSGGVFLYVHLLTDMLSKGNVSTDQFPRGLNAIFDSWFSRYFPDMNEYDQFFRLPLGIIASSSNGIPLSELEHVDGWYDSKNRRFLIRESNERAISRNLSILLRRCTPILKYSRDSFGQQTVMFSHKYIAEWLLADGDNPDGSYMYNDFSCQRAEALWILGTTWQNLLEKRETLSIYQALNLLNILSAVNTHPNIIKDIARNPYWEKSLLDYYHKYHEGNALKSCLSFVKANYQRALFAYGKVDSDTVPERELLISTLSELGYLPEAITYAKENCEALYRLSDSNNPAFINAMEEHALLNYKAGYLKTAIHDEELVLKARIILLGEDHLDTVSSYHRLAEMYYRAEQYGNSKINAEIALNKMRSLLGEDHKETIKSQLLYLKSQHKIDPKFDLTPHYRNIYKLCRSKYGVDDPIALNIVEDVAIMLFDKEDYQRALKLFKHLHMHYMTTKGASDQTSIQCQYSLAKCLLETSDFDSALREFQSIYELQREIWGADHPKTIESLEHIADVYIRSSSIEKAEQLLDDVYNKWVNAIGISDKKTSSTFYKILNLQWQTKRFENARNLARERYCKIRNILGINDDHTILAKIIVAQAYAKEKNYDTAYQLRKEILDTISETEDSSSDAVQKAKILVAESLYQLDRDQESFDLMHDVYGFLLLKHGEKNPLTIRAMQGLAMTSWTLGQREKAINLEKQVYEFRKSLWGCKDMDVLNSLENLCHMLEDSGNLNEATIYYQLLLETCATKIDKTRTEHKLAWILEQLGQDKEALEHRIHVFDECTSIFGSDSVFTLTAIVKLVVAYMKLNQRDSALSLIEQFSHTQYNVDGYILEDTVDSLKQMCDLCVKEKNHVGEIKAKQLLVKIYKQKYGINSAEFLDALIDLSNVFSEHRMYSDYLNARITILEIYQQTKGENCHETLQAMIYLAKAYTHLRLYEQALQLAQKAYNGRLSLNGENHYETITAMKWIAHIYSLWDKKEEANLWNSKISSFS